MTHNEEYSIKSHSFGSLGVMQEFDHQQYVSNREAGSRSADSLNRGRSRILYPKRMPQDVASGLTGYDL